MSMGKDIAVKPMTDDEACSFIASIKSRIGDIREMLIELHDREGWKARGYDTWEECVAKEFPDWCKRHADRLRLAGRVQKAIEAAAPKTVGPMGPKSAPPPIPERHLRPLGDLPEDQQVAAYMDAKDEADKAGKPLTAKDVKAKADLYKADNEPYVAPEKEAPEPEWDPAVAKKAKTALGQLVRALDSLGVVWKEMTLQQVKSTVEK